MSCVRESKHYYGVGLGVDLSSDSLQYAREIMASAFGNGFHNGSDLWLQNAQWVTRSLCTYGVNSMNG